MVAYPAVQYLVYFYKDFVKLHEVIYTSFLLILSAFVLEAWTIMKICFAGL